ncbi:hypothetical protein TNCV_4425611 [Trichonephila clavipes]|nr:hypothetical protein TNCV_4425611 [Trichonephila clavipes]
MLSAFAAWGTLKSHRAANPLVRLIEGKERWDAPEPSQVPIWHGGTLNSLRATSPLPDRLQGGFTQNWNGTESNRTVTCMVLKAKANNRRTSSPLSQ